MGKSDCHTAKSSRSCLEPWQGPWRAVVPGITAPQPWGTLNSLQERLGLGDRGWDPLLGLSSSQESPTSLRKPQRGVPMLQGREKGGKGKHDALQQAEPNLCSIPAASLASSHGPPEFPIPACARHASSSTAITGFATCKEKGHRISLHFIHFRLEKGCQGEAPL